MRAVSSCRLSFPMTAQSVTEQFLWGFFWRFYLFIFREGERREKERERSINVWLPLTCLLLGTWPATQACALTGNWTSSLLIHSPVLNPLSHTSQVLNSSDYVRKGLIGTSTHSSLWLHSFSMFLGNAPHFQASPHKWDGEKRHLPQMVSKHMLYQFQHFGKITVWYSSMNRKKKHFFKDAHLLMRYVFPVLDKNFLFLSWNRLVIKLESQAGIVFSSISLKERERERTWVLREDKVQRHAYSLGYRIRRAGLPWSIPWYSSLPGT